MTRGGTRYVCGYWQAASRVTKTSEKAPSFRAGMNRRKWANGALTHVGPM